MGDHKTAIFPGATSIPRQIWNHPSALFISTKTNSSVSTPSTSISLEKSQNSMTASFSLPLSPPLLGLFTTFYSLLPDVTTLVHTLLHTHDKSQIRTLTGLQGEPVRTPPACASSSLLRRLKVLPVSRARYFKNTIHLEFILISVRYLQFPPVRAVTSFPPHRKGDWRCWLRIASSTKNF